MANGSPDPVDAARPPDADLERLRHLAYIVLPPSLGRPRRARIADELARANLADGTSYPAARDRCIHEVLRVSPRPSGLAALTARASRGGDSPAESALAAMTPATRAAYVLTRLDGVPVPRAEALLKQAGVADPRTAVAMAGRADLTPVDVRAVVVPLPTGSRRPRLIAAAAAVLVVGVAAPVIAVTTGGGGGDTPEPVSNQTPTQPDKAAIAKAVQLDRDLTRILARLDEELARKDQDQAEIKRLKTLRAAVIAQQKQLGSPQ
ncbi:MAG TPA: hypothetical protein VNC22_16895 [Sporichthya sp.]|nr:hypothetical protein [Sporichthya sp.]